MTEDQWAACKNPAQMVDFLSGKISDRKLRLLAVAFCRRFIPRMTEFGDVVRAIEVAEGFADGLATEAELNSLRAIIPRRNEEGAAMTACSPDARWAARTAASRSADVALHQAWVNETPRQRKRRSQEGRHARRAEVLAQVSLVHDIVGDPFHLCVIDPVWLAWHEGTIPRIAQRIYDERRFEDMPILADALEDAGCCDEVILTHCRGENSHVRGCWVLDLLLSLK
jgi:hypothetical protein